MNGTHLLLYLPTCVHVHTTECTQLDNLRTKEAAVGIGDVLFLCQSDVEAVVIWTPAGAKDVQGFRENVVVNEAGVHGEYPHQQEQVPPIKQHAEHLHVKGRRVSMGTFKP